MDCSMFSLQEVALHTLAAHIDKVQEQQIQTLPNDLVLLLWRVGAGMKGDALTLVLLKGKLNPRVLELFLSDKRNPDLLNEIKALKLRDTPVLLKHETRNGWLGDKSNLY